MGKRDTEYTAFVDERGPALARTASLLEMDAAAADQALVATVGWASRRWRAISREGSVEAHVRQRLYRQLADRWRRSGTLHAVPPPESLVESTRERQALGALSNADRALVVLVGYESLSAREADAVLRLGADDPEVALGSANARFRSIAGAQPDAQLLPLLNAAALRDVPDDLAVKARAESRSSSRRAYAIAGVMVASAAAVAGFALLAPSSGGSDPTSAVGANIDRWGVPAEPPGPEGLPSLAEEPIETASMAYVTDGVPIVTDAATSEARTVLGGRPQPEWYDGNVDGVVTGLLRPGPPWTQAVLSPDGQWLLLVQAPRAFKGPRPTGELYLVRVASGEVVRLPDADPAASPRGVASIANSVLAWAPGGGGFACVCNGRLGVFDLDKVTPTARLKWSTEERFTDVAWGIEGLLGRQLSGGWVSETRGGVVLSGLGVADAVAASMRAPAFYLSVGVTSIYALGADTEPDGGRCVLWNADFSRPVEVQPVPDRDGPLCTAVSLQPGRSGVLLVLRPHQPRPDDLPLDVAVVDADGATTVIGSLPPGTTFGSFAANLVG